MEWLAFKGEKKKRFVSGMYEGSNSDPQQTFSFKDQAPRHCATRAQLPMQELVIVFFSCLRSPTIKHPWRNDFNNHANDFGIPKKNTEHSQTFLHRIFCFHFVRNRCWLGQQSQSAPLSMVRNSHQNRNVRRLYTSVECLFLLISSSKKTLFFYHWRRREPKASRESTKHFKVYHPRPGDISPTLP